MQNQSVPSPTSNRQPFENERELLSDLFTPNPQVFWLDLLISATVGWGSFGLACWAQPLSGLMFASAVVAVFSLYRSLVFIHELSHLKAKDLPGFITGWNLLVGVPLLFPSFIYVGMHADHHRLATYGTKEDPEYLPFAGLPLAIAGFLVQSVILPLLMVVRFVVLSPVGLIFPTFHRMLETYASSLTMNLEYRRRISDAERGPMKKLELAILLVWFWPLLAIALGKMPWHIPVLWYAIVAMISLINVVRTLGAHRYQAVEENRSRTDQLLDSVDTPGNVWTELWGPVGLRYHALHHYFPTIPYHNLATAHQRLLDSLPETAAYRQTLSPSLWHSLRSLWIGSPNPVAQDPISPESL
jgi:fatty acid desaturase